MSECKVGCERLSKSVVVCQTEAREGTGERKTGLGNQGEKKENNKEKTAR